MKQLYFQTNYRVKQIEGQNNCIFAIYADTLATRNTPHKFMPAHDFARQDDKNDPDHRQSFTGFARQSAIR
jgi:hypothetical protein